MALHACRPKNAMSSEQQTLPRDSSMSDGGHWFRPKLKPEFIQEGSMSDRTAQFTQQNAERAFQAATVGMSWLQEAAEQTLSQSQAVIQTMVALTRKAGDGLNQQAQALHRCSLAAAEESFANAFELGHKMARLRDPQQLVEAQSDFFGRQMEIIATHSKELARSAGKEAAELTSATIHEPKSAGRRSEAA
jgi:hypothetical protein